MRLYILHLLLLLVEHMGVRYRLTPLISIVLATVRMGSTVRHHRKLPHGIEPGVCFMLLGHMVVVGPPGIVILGDVHLVVAVPIMLIHIREVELEILDVLHTRRVLLLRLDENRVAHLASIYLNLLTRDDINQEIIHIALGECMDDIGLLEGFALVFLSVDPRAGGELCDEELDCLCEHHRRLCRNHLYILIELHDLLDAGQRQLVLAEGSYSVGLLRLLGPEAVDLLHALELGVLQRLHLDMLLL